MSDCTTEGVRVEIMSRYSASQSKPGQSDWVFEYTVRITNVGQQDVQLMSRHWIIVDALEREREVKGEGVIGQQPFLAPGESFVYSSWCPLKTPTGSMRGWYHMVRGADEEFTVKIAEFGLRATAAALQ